MEGNIEMIDPIENAKYIARLNREIELLNKKLEMAILSLQHYETVFPGENELAHTTLIEIEKMNNDPQKVSTKA
jgi:type III secretory pathway component EscU